MHNVPHTEAAKEKMRISHTGIMLPWKQRRSIEINGERLWRCGRCGGYFPREDFYKDNRTVLGMKSECKACHTSTSIKSRDLANTKRLGREAEARRRARKAGSETSISASDMKAIETLWGEKCLKCGSIESLQWDHVVPISNGGHHCIDNLQRLCRKCNERKQARFADYRTEEQKRWAIEFMVMP